MHVFPSKEHQKMMSKNSNQLILSTRHNLIRIRKESLIREPPRITNTIFPRRYYHDKEMHVLCSNKVNFVIKHPTVQNNKQTINECLEIFHKARNIDKVRRWKKLHTTMKHMNMITMGCTTSLRYVKN